MQAKTFQRKVLAWFDEFGRKDLPWQKNKTPYRVWVSEIMLQQTQVATVIPYFERFMQSFPNVKTLALAAEDEVLAHWSGLGYYARARNLHKAAKIVAANNSRFPRTVEGLTDLPGIGRSTAGAILSCSMNLRAPILDGNVKRVLARLHTVEGHYSQSKTLEQLWHFAEKYTPTERVADFTQAMMDLGATVCTRTKPCCDACPLAKSCQALQQDVIADFPAKKKRKALPVKEACFLVITDKQGWVLLEKRPPSGIWGGLWCLPELPADDALAKWGKSHLGLSLKLVKDLDEFRHTFSHYHLDISPKLVRADSKTQQVMDSANMGWYKLGSTKKLGLAKPVSDLINKVVL